MNTLEDLRNETKTSDFIVSNGKICIHVKADNPMCLTDFIDECEAFGNKIYGIPVEFATRGYSYSFFCKTWKHNGARITCINTERCESIEYYAVKCVKDDSVSTYEFEILD